MKQLQLSAPETLEILEVPTPAPSSGQVLARPLRTGICGTDVHSFFGETIFGKVFPFHIGHEICASVLAAPENPNLSPGDLIVVNPFFPCGSCTACYMGRENNCLHRTTIGLTGPGGFSEVICIPAASALRVPRGMDPTVMCLAEPLSTVLYGFHKLRIDPTSSVLIQGAGTIGLMFLQLVLSAGAARITVTDLNRKKLDAAIALGADAALCPADQEDLALLNELGVKGFDIVIDCTGSIASMQSSPERIAFGGQILLFGLCSASATMTIRPFQLYQKDASILTSFALNKASFAEAAALLANGRIRTDLLIDSVQPPSQLETALRRIAAGKASGKIVIDMAQL